MKKMTWTYASFKASQILQKKNQVINKIKLYSHKDETTINSLREQNFQTLLQFINRNDELTILKSVAKELY